MGAWRGHLPSVLPKGEQRGRRGLSIIGLRAGTFLELRRIFARISPNLPDKFFVQLLPTNSLPQRSLKPFLVWPPKKVFMCFCKPWGPFFEVKQRLASFLHGFSEMLPRFSANQNFWECACTPCTPISNNTAFDSSIIGNFVVYQDRLGTVIAAFRAPRKFRMIFYNFCYYFWVQHCWWTETNIIGKGFFVFYKFPLPSTVLLLSLPYPAPASLNMHVASTNFVKTLVANLNMTSCFDVTNSVYPVTRTTIRHCSTLEFGRGHPIKQSPRASPDLWTPLAVGQGEQ